MKILKSIRQIKLFQPILRMRDWLWKHLGLFKLKARIKQYFFFKRLVREDAALKKEILQKIEALPDNMLQNATADCVVSLTSYGKRVEDTLPYTLCSLLIQTVVPKHIAVYLDYDNWNEDKLPVVLKTLQRKGVEFYFCEDIRSYKKLIPALQMFPDSPIITVDDDFYYNPQLIEWLWDEYQHSDKKIVIGSWGCIVEKRDGGFIPYSQWKDCKYGDENSDYSLFAGNGTLYPPHIFDTEICNKEAFMKLCPTADDIWFWAMERRQGIKIKMIPQCGYGLHHSVNRIEEYDLTQTGTLMFTNVAGGKNDEQFYKLVEKYNLE